MQLNDEQQKAVLATERFLFLLAGAGTGKTKVVVERIRHMISKGVLEHHILAITFTKKAASEMKERLKNQGVHIHTFHSLCHQYLKETLKIEFEMIDEQKMPFRPDETLAISLYKNSLKRLKKPAIYERYQAFLKQNKWKDFDDLLIETIEALKNKPQDLYHSHIFVDEFQDTNPLQFKLLKTLIKSDTHVFAVGDPDQSIYRFRGAYPTIILEYEKTFQAKRYPLTLNYRSTKAIIQMANQIIFRHQKMPKQLVSTSPHKGLCYRIYYPSIMEECRQVIRLIRYLKKKHKSYPSIGILYRHHLRVSDLILALHEADIPFDIDDGADSTEYGIKLLTIHQAKGLEFEAVILLGFEKGQLPSYQAQTKAEHDEERRLLFVAVTRAKMDLFATATGVSSLFQRESGLKTVSPSQLDDIISLGD